MGPAKNRFKNRNGRSVIIEWFPRINEYDGRKKKETERETVRIFCTFKRFLLNKRGDGKKEGGIRRKRQAGEGTEWAPVSQQIHK